MGQTNATVLQVIYATDDGGSRCRGAGFDVAWFETWLNQLISVQLFSFSEPQFPHW